MSNAATMLGQWSTFFTLTGSAAATLTGLMFVVITLVTRRERSDRTTDGFRTYTTPSVVYLGAALLVSIVLCAPWRVAFEPAIVTGILGLSGAIHMVRIIGRARSLKEYTPDLEDRTFYMLLPLLAYCAILAGAIWMFWSPAALFATGSGVTLLIFIGIHNAWDIVTYLTILGPQDP